MHRNESEIRKCLCVDMDGTLAVWQTAATEEELYQEGYFRDIPCYPDAVDAVKVFNKNPAIEVYILTSIWGGMPYAIPEKNVWLDRYFPEIDANHRIFVTGGQSKADAIKARGWNFDEDIVMLWDDYTPNLTDWTISGGFGIKALNGINNTNGTWQGEAVRVNAYKVQNPVDDLRNAIRNCIAKAELCTWDDLYALAMDTAYGDDALKAKDTARYEFGGYIHDLIGISIEDSECVEDAIDDFLNKYGDVMFDIDGHLIEFDGRTLAFRKKLLEQHHRLDAKQTQEG